MSFVRPIVLLAALVAGVGACGRREVPPDMLVVAADRDVEGIDPHTSGQVLQTQTVLANLYEGLITFDGQMSLVPALALSWSNPDELTWDFQIRTDVPFQTGGVLDGEDVVFSLLRARDNPRSVLRGALANVSEIRTISRDRVRIRTTRVDASFISRLRQVFITPACARKPRETMDSRRLSSSLRTFSGSTRPFPLFGRTGTRRAG